MKKLAIFVATLMVATGGLGTLAANVLAEENNSSNPKEDVLYLTPNKYTHPQGTLFEFLKPGRNSLSLQLPVEGGRAWRAMRIIFAQQDYEAGYTREEAEAELAQLGVGETKSLKIMHDQDARNSTPLGWTLGMNKIEMAENKSDRIYFAFQLADFKNVDGEKTWNDVWWERGVIDYRDCMHTANFHLDTAFCRLENTGKGTYRIDAADNMTWEWLERPAGEKILTWGEELMQIQQSRIQAVRDELAGLNVESEGLEETLARLETELDQIEIGIKKVAGTEAMQEEIVELREIIQSLRKALADKNPSGDGGEDDKKDPEDDKKDPAEGEGSGGDGDDKKPEDDKGTEGDKTPEGDEKPGEGGDSGATGEPGGSEGTEGDKKPGTEVKPEEPMKPGETDKSETNKPENDKKPGGSGENTVSGNKVANLPLLANVAVAGAQAGNGARYDSDQEDGAGKTADKTPGEENGSGKVENAGQNLAKNQAETVETPKLGKVEKRGGIWWLIGLVAAATGIMGAIIIKRRKQA